MVTNLQGVFEDAPQANMEQEQIMRPAKIITKDQRAYGTVYERFHRTELPGRIPADDADLAYPGRRLRCY